MFVLSRVRLHVRLAGAVVSELPVTDAALVRLDAKMDSEKYNKVPFSRVV